MPDCIRMFWAVFWKNPEIVKRQSSEREERSRQTAPHDEKLDWRSWFWQRQHEDGSLSLTGSIVWVWISHNINAEWLTASKMMTIRLFFPSGTYSQEFWRREPLSQGRIHEFLIGAKPSFPIESWWQGLNPGREIPKLRRYGDNSVLMAWIGWSMEWLGPLGFSWLRNYRLDNMSNELMF